MSVQIGQLTITANQNTTFNAPNNGQKAILIGNESGLTCTVTMEGGSVQKTLYPSMLDWFPVRSGFTGNILISPTAILNNVSSWPSSTLVFDAIGLNDHENAGQYPLQLNRTANVGNTVSTNMGSSTSLQNDNNSDDTQVIEMQMVAAPSSTGRWGNNGNFYIKQYVGGVLTTLFQVIENASTTVKIAATGKIAEILGSLTVDQNLTVAGTSSIDNTAITTDGAGNVTKVGAVTSSGTISCSSVTASGHIDVTTNNTTFRMKDSGGTLRDVLYVDTSNGTDLQAAALNGAINLKNQDGTNYLIIGSGKIGVTAAADILDASSPTAVYFKCRNNSGSINFQMPDGNTIVSFDSTGINAANGVNFNVGRIKDINSGTTSATGTINHGLSGTPTAVLCTTDSASSTQTEGADTYTSTQFSHRSGSGLTTRWVAYR